MSDAAPARFGRRQALTAAGGAAVLAAAVVLLAAPDAAPGLRAGAGLLALVVGAVLVVVAVLPFVRRPWARAAFWGAIALAVVPVAVVGDAGVRVPALLVGLLAVAQCGLGVLVWRRSRASESARP